MDEINFEKPDDGKSGNSDLNIQLDNDSKINLNPVFEPLKNLETFQNLNPFIVPDESLLIVRPMNDWILEAKNTKIPAKLFGDFWFENEISILFASSGVGKTLLAYQIADSITLGGKCMIFESECEPQKVVYCDFELSSKQVESRYSENFTNHYEFSPNFFRVEINPDADIFDSTKFEETIISELEKKLNSSGAKILIVDNITYFHDDQERAKYALKLMKKLKVIKKRMDLSMLVLAHTPKRDASKPITRNDISGSSMIINFTDSAFSIGESTRSSEIRYLKQIKPGRFSSTKYDSENVIVCSISNPLNFTRFSFVEFDSEKNHLKEQDEKSSRNNEMMLMHKSGASLREIASKFGLSPEGVNKALNKMKTNGG